jgi:hypothetical protein
MRSLPVPADLRRTVWPTCERRRGVRRKPGPPLPLLSPEPDLPCDCELGAVVEVAGTVGVVEVVLEELESDPPQAASAHAQSRTRGRSGRALTGLDHSDSPARACHHRMDPAACERCGTNMAPMFSRLTSILIVAACLGLAACGGNDDKQASTPTTQPGATAPGTTGPTTPSGATGKQKRHNGAGSKSGRAKSRQREGTGGSSQPTRPPRTHTGGFGGERGVTYGNSRNICRRSSAKQIADIYDISSRNPKRIARVYVHRTYPPPLRRAAYEGCLAGLRK